MCAAVDPNVSAWGDGDGVRRSVQDVSVEHGDAAGGGENLASWRDEKRFGAFVGPGQGGGKGARQVRAIEG